MKWWLIKKNRTTQMRGTDGSPVMPGNNFFLLENGVVVKVTPEFAALAALPFGHPRHHDCVDRLQLSMIILWPFAGNV
jgi:hypothetical protein